MRDWLLNIKILLSFCDIIKRRDFILGKAVREFESKLASYLGAKYVLGVASGTDALILSLKACGIEHGDEVIVPAVSAFSTAGAVSWIGAKPVFVDVEYGSLNIDPRLIERAITPRAKAVVVAHLNGRMADMEQIMRIAKHKSLVVIEDAARALGARYKDHHPGHYGDAACFSFNPQKNLSTYGDGGAAATNNTNIAEKISCMRFYGARRYEDLHRFHPISGIANRLQSFQAAVLSIKITGFNRMLEESRRRFLIYYENLDGMDDLVLPDNRTEYFVNGHYFFIFTKKRDELLSFLKENKVKAKVDFRIPLPYLEAFRGLKHKKGDFPVAERVAEEILFLPTDCALSEKEIYRICALVKKFFQNPG